MTQEPIKLTKAQAAERDRIVSEVLASVPEGHSAFAVGQRVFERALEFAGEVPLPPLDDDARERLAEIIKKNLLGYLVVASRRDCRKVADAVAAEMINMGYVLRQDSNLEAPMSTKGLYNKFSVTRTDGRDAPGEKHEGCEYFVLDLTHDKYAIPALKAYAKACSAEFPQLAADLDDRRRALELADTEFVRPQR